MVLKCQDLKVRLAHWRGPGRGAGSRGIPKRAREVCVEDKSDSIRVSGYMLTTRGRRFIKP